MVVRLATSRLQRGDAIERMDPPAAVVLEAGLSSDTGGRNGDEFGRGAAADAVDHAGSAKHGVA
jgi:hypothetical protein